MASCSQQQPDPLALQHLPPPLQQALQPIAQLLGMETIPLQSLRPLISKGLPEQCPLLRELTWKLILGYLPPSRHLWSSSIAKQEELYTSFLRQFIGEDKYKDAPLCPRSQENWQLYEKDYHLWQQIEKDTSRTHAQLAFFSVPSRTMVPPFFTATRKEKYKLISGDQRLSCLSEAEKRQSYVYDHMTRILYIFAKLNPKAAYVQGMNEILAPILFLVNAHHPKEPVQEAACFFMFNNVMSDLVDIHITDFGNMLENPIHGRIRRISTMLLALQPQAWQKLQQLKIDPFFYSFRWITLLFSQQFELHDTLKLWQSIFSHNDRSSHTDYITLSLLLASSKTIISGDYSQIMHHLKFIGQRMDLDGIIGQAHRLHCQHSQTDFCLMAEASRLTLGGKKGKRQQLFQFVRALF